MNYPKYDLVSNDASTIFEFISIGNNGEISKAILYASTNDENVYNLSFGNKIMSGSGQFNIDDRIITDNGDRNIILATVAWSVYIFTEKYPNYYVFFRGSTPSRTRLYRMAISNSLGEISETFSIFGAMINKNGKVMNVPFNPKNDFFGFIIKRK